MYTREEVYKPKNAASLSFSIGSSGTQSSFSFTATDSDDDQFSVNSSRIGLIDYEEGGRC